MLQLLKVILLLLLFLVVITDPGIKVDHGYKPYDDGISQGVFVKVCVLCVMCINAFSSYVYTV